MPTELGIAVTAWTARLAILAYAARIWIDVAYGNNIAWQKLARWFWSIGLFVFCLHVIAAFHFYHQWSHVDAWEHTRQQTLLRTGYDSGGGLWLNYLFLALWSVDVIAWWRSIDWPDRWLWYAVTQAFMAFMVLNATAVFGPSGWIPVVAFYIFGLLWCSRRRWRSMKHHDRA